MDAQLPPVRLTVLHAEAYQFPSTWTFPPAVIPYSIARIVTEGSSEFIIDGAAFPVETGDVALIPEGSVLECRSTSNRLGFISVRFSTSASIAGRDYFSDYLGLRHVSSHHGDQELLGHFEAVVSAWSSPSAIRIFLTTGHLNLIIAAVAAQMGSAQPTRAPGGGPKPGSAQTLDPRVVAIVDRLAANPKGRPNIKQLCSQVHLSESALRRLFKTQMGKTISEYHRDMRMMAAARALLLSNESIGDIAQDFGFHDANYFTRMFHGVFGIPPTSYRRLTRQG